jgi:hypothetical protein
LLKFKIMDAKEQIFSLMAAAEQQQQAIDVAIQSLENERLALAKERAALSQATVSLTATVATALPAIQKAAGEAVGVSVKQSLAGASNAAAKALGEAAKPVIDSLSGVVQAAHEAEGSMRNAGAWFAWKWVAVTAGGLVGVCLVAYVSLAWQLHQVSSLRGEKAKLAADVAQMQANVSALEKRGGRIVMATCGGRLCIEASSNQGAGAEQWKGGSWSNKETGVQLVIPRGY